MIGVVDSGQEPDGHGVLEIDRLEAQPASVLRSRVWPRSGHRRPTSRRSRRDRGIAVRRTGGGDTRGWCTTLCGRFDGSISSVFRHAEINEPRSSERMIT